MTIKRQIFCSSGRVAVSLTTVLFLAAASEAMARAANVQDGQAERIGQVCTAVLRVEPGEAHHAGCVESLSQSARTLEQGRAIQRAREGCLNKGFKVSSTDLSVCTLQSTQTDRAGAPIASASPTRAEPIPGGPKSYFYASNQDRFRREQLACAEIGLDPTSGAFGSCVAGLRATLFALDNPSP